MGRPRPRPRQPRDPHPPRLAWRVGVDLGGTWVRVVAEDAAGRRRALTHRAVTLEALPHLLRAAWRRWRFRPTDVAGLVVSSRGVWTPREQRLAGRRLARLARRATVVPDAQAAYEGALGDGPGVLLLAGTGSIAVGRDARGRFARTGGLGPLVGDEGSAFWIGREWLHARLAGVGGGPGFAAAHRLLTGEHAVARIAALAPSVLRRVGRGDPTARRIQGEAQAELASLVLTLARDLQLEPPVRVSWAGSVIADSRFRAGIWRIVRRHGLRLQPSPPRVSPVEAALVLARRLGRRPHSTRAIRRANR